MKNGLFQVSSILRLCVNITLGNAQKRHFVKKIIRQLSLFNFYFCFLSLVFSPFFFRYFFWFCWPFAGLCLRWKVLAFKCTHGHKMFKTSEAFQWLQNFSELTRIPAASWRPFSANGLLEHRSSRFVSLCNLHLLQKETKFFYKWQVVGILARWPAIMPELIRSRFL